MGLVELLVVAPLMLLVLTAIFSFTNLAISDSAQSTSRSRALLNAQTGLDRMAHDIRGADANSNENPSIYQVGSSAIDLRICGDWTCAAGSTYWVRWDCGIADPEHRDLIDGNITTLYACGRSKAATRSGLGQDPLLMIRNVLPPAGSVFSPGWAWAWVDIAVRVKVKGSPASGTLLSDRVVPRNIVKTS